MIAFWNISVIIWILLRLKKKAVSTSMKLQVNCLKWFLHFLVKAISNKNKKIMPSTLKKLLAGSISTIAKPKQHERQQRYGHEYYKSIAQRYIAKPFDEYSDKEEDSWEWVWFSTYQPLDLVTLGYWLTLLKEEKIEEEDQADAFRRYADGEDIRTEVKYYKTAIQKFRIRFGDIPIKVARYERSE